MAADVELLHMAAFTKALKGERGLLDAWLEVNDEREVRAHVESYARTNVEHHTAAQAAEIEALRAEVGKRNGIDPWAVLIRAQEAEARAERLAEALRKLSADLRTLAGGETPDGDGVPVNVILWAEKRLAALRIAIDQSRGKGVPHD